MHKLVTNANYLIQETNVAQLPKNMGYSNNGGYTIAKKEYYSLLESQNKFAHQTENGIIIQDIAEPMATHIREMSKMIKDIEDDISTLEKTITNIQKYPALERCNTIVYYENTGLSFGVDEEKKLFIRYTKEPTQFTSEKAEEICKNVTNGRGESPIMGSKLEFSEALLKNCKDKLNIFLNLKHKFIENVVLDSLDVVV